MRKKFFSTIHNYFITVLKSSRNWNVDEYEGAEKDNKDEAKIHNFPHRFLLLNTAFTARGSKIMLSRFRVTLIVVVSHKENNKKRWRRERGREALWQSTLSYNFIIAMPWATHTIMCFKYEKTTTSAMLMWFKAKQTQIIIFSSHFYRFGDLLVPSLLRSGDERRLH